MVIPAGQIKSLRMLKKPSKKEEERIKERVRDRFDGRWLIVILFLATVIASLFFYLQTELPVWLEQVFGSEVIISRPPIS
ncbi:MAG: hypothetical protein JW991_04935 [Candidatus Pacebacteria bacterium]|nr:hypothetical protein [Candidatus Paceibacterota bacterium]